MKFTITTLIKTLAGFHLKGISHNNYLDVKN